MEQTSDGEGRTSTDQEQESPGGESEDEYRLMSARMRRDQLLSDGLFEYLCRVLSPETRQVAPARGERPVLAQGGEVVTTEAMPETAPAAVEDPTCPSAERKGTAQRDSMIYEVRYARRTPHARPETSLPCSCRPRTQMLSPTCTP